MKTLSIKSSVYFNPDTHQALRLHATHNQTSMSALVNEAVSQMLRDDQDDLSAFDQRTAEPEISRRALLANLKRHNKL